jgi:hypothetical protein
MKKVFSFLLAVMLLVSFSVSAFAAGNVSKRESTAVTEVKTAVDANGADVVENVKVTNLVDTDPATAAFIESFDNYFETDEGLQKAAGENGVEVGSVFELEAGESVAFPVSFEFVVDHADIVVALLHITENGFEALPFEKDGDNIKAELPENGKYMFVAQMGLPGAPGSNSFVVNAGGTKFVASAEVKTEPAVVEIKTGDDVDPDSLVVITRGDEKYSLTKSERDIYTAAVEELVSNFDAFVAEHPEFEGTAPSSGFFVDGGANASKNLPAEVTLDVLDADIISGLLVLVDGEWQSVDITVNEAKGEMSFMLSQFGVYVILSEAAAD